MHDNDKRSVRNVQRFYAWAIIGLTGACAVFVLSLAVAVGMNVSALFDASPAEAAQSVLPSPTAPNPDPTAVTPEPTATAAPPEPTPVPATPMPTASPTQTAEPDSTPEPAASPVAYVEAGTDGANVRTGPSIEAQKVGVLEPGARAVLVGRFENWWQIAYQEERRWVRSDVVKAVASDAVPEVDVRPHQMDGDGPGTTVPVWAVDEARWIDVDLSDQRLTAYERTKPVKSYLVSTGLPQTPTPVGQFRIWIKLRYDDMAGADYYIEDVPFVMYFHEGYGLHGVTWHANFGNRMSHGCVNQPNEMAEWLFDFAGVGTLVNIHE